MQNRTLSSNGWVRAQWSNNSLNTNIPLPSGLARTITKEASQQTYYTIRFLVDRDRTAHAFRTYAYFRWLDNTLDKPKAAQPDRLALLQRQQVLADRCFRGEWPSEVSPEEQMLVDLIRSDQSHDNGLYTYIRNMMTVMDFDTHRRGTLIGEDDLASYSLYLATAVTEALHYFIGHGQAAPHDDTRYLAVTGAHVVHMLRDTFEDTEAGYFNIPREVLEKHGLTPTDVHHLPYRTWVEERVHYARSCFQAGTDYLAQVENARCRLAGFAYMARFEGILDMIERDGYGLRPHYAKANHLNIGLRLSRHLSHVF